jgi:hypothetical protein
METKMFYFPIDANFSGVSSSGGASWSIRGQSTDVGNGINGLSRLDGNSTPSCFRTGKDIELSNP